MNISPHLTAFMLILHAATALGQSDTLPVYRSLREALLEPDKVLSLDLSDQPGLCNSELEWGLEELHLIEEVLQEVSSSALG